MTRQLNLIAFVTAIAAGMALAAPAAQAADYPSFGYNAPQPPRVQEFVSGWYLRGDIGWRRDTKIGDITSNFPLPDMNDISDVATIGGGGGYKQQWFRADVTLDYAGKADYDGNLGGAHFTGKIESFTALANIYLDLGTWAGFTPYIGAGAGAVVFRAYDFRPPLGIVSLDYPTQTEFAWAYMAGASYAIAPRWLVDFSYRRLNYGDMTFNPKLQNALSLKDLSANEFRIGVRYNLD